MEPMRSLIIYALAWVGHAAICVGTGVCVDVMVRVAWWLAHDPRFDEDVWMYPAWAAAAGALAWLRVAADYPRRQKAK